MISYAFGLPHIFCGWAVVERVMAFEKVGCAETAATRAMNEVKAEAIANR